MSSTPVKSCIIMPPQTKENVNDSNPTETEVFHESPIDLPISTNDHSSPSAVTPPTASITSMYMTNSTLSEILHDMSRLSIVPETNRKQCEDGLVQSIANAYAEKTAEYRSLIEEYLEPDISCHQNSLIKDRNSTSESNGVAVLPDVSLILPTCNHPDGDNMGFEVSNNANSPSEKSEKSRNVSDGEEHNGARESFLQAKPGAYDSIAPAAESIYSEDSILTELNNFSGFTSAAAGRVIEENAEEAPHNDELGPLPDAKTSPKQHKRFRRSFGGANTMDEAECITTHEEATITELLEICGQKKPVTFGEALSEYNLVKKLGEATFSEVYSFTTKTQDARPLAVKVMPFGAPKHKLHVNGSPQITVHEVTQEVLITKALSDFERDQNCTREVVNNKNITIGSSFVPLVNLHICKGTYSFELLEAWDTWTETKDSENDRPDFFPKSQLFVVIVLANGGTDLEHFKIRPISTGPMPSTPLIKSRGLNSTTVASSAAPNKTWAMVTSILQQTILSLYIAERDLKFEHRDLHWGNILCQTNAEYAGAAKEYYCGEELGWIRVPLEGVKVAIIDYTLSRCQSGKRLFFNRMDDESFYTGEGDYQFDIYRMMREETRGDWMAFHPKTNVLWIHYLLHKLLKGKSLPVAGAVAKEKRKELEGFQKRVLSYASVRELVERDVMFETNYLKDV
ncbi:hypothetical protein BDR26DRAFT_862562 [Obelidium mucronatum]|nr:hypothetical protein BDR26DRAFT_862562 [Obelidium mucronatum]